MVIKVDEVRQDLVAGIARYLDEERRLAYVSGGRDSLLKLLGRKTWKLSSSRDKVSGEVLWLRRRNQNQKTG